MLRNRRNDWDMSFATSGAKALQTLASTPIDIVVSDMKMPEMDGATFLSEVQKRHPETIRIILSGFAESEAVIRTIGPSHQYLAKPCDPDTLCGAIERAIDHCAFIRCDAVRKLVTGLREVPVLPATLSTLVNEIEAPDSSVSAVAKTIANDAAMTAQILKLVNSAYFGLPRQVATPLQAVQLLGLETIKALALVANIFNKFEGDEAALEKIDQTNRRSLKIGALAKSIAEAEGFEKPIVQQACCAGVLSHIGVLPLVTAWSDRWSNVVSAVDNDGLCITDAEESELNTNHAEIGGYLLAIWGFNAEIFDAVRYHHTPADALPHAPNAITAVHIAQYLVRKDRDSYCNGCGLDQDYIAGLGLSDRLPEWQTAYEKLEHRDLGR